jgi:nucleoside-diphosphate-sugar epimerase
LVRDGHTVVAPVRDPQKLSRLLATDRVDASRVVPWPASPDAWPDQPLTGAVLGAGVLFARCREEYWATNVDWTLACLRRLPSGCPVVVVSSQAAGGPTPRGRLTRSEADADAPITWYGESKLAMERAVLADFSDRALSVLRPPMILGARDTATLPLFAMARGAIRPKPGMRDKFYSFVAVDDLVAAIRLALQKPLGPSACYLAAEAVITDTQLIAAAAAVAGGQGVTLPVPQWAVRGLSLLVDAVPALRAKTPSLTRDRARDIWENRWVVSGQKFSAATGWTARQGLREALASAWSSYREAGLA